MIIIKHYYRWYCCPFLNNWVNQSVSPLRFASCLFGSRKINMAKDFLIWRKVKKPMIIRQNRKKIIKKSDILSKTPISGENKGLVFIFSKFVTLRKCSIKIDKPVRRVICSRRDYALVYTRYRSKVVKTRTTHWADNWYDYAIKGC